MGISERREREKEEMKDLILQAALKLFLENGYEKTSIRAIADLIEYSPATIYLYYKDKNELFLEIQMLAFESMNEAFEGILVIQDPLARLIKIGELYIQFALDHPELYDLMFIMEAPMESLDCQDKKWQDGQASFESLKMIIRDCQDANYFKKEYDVETLSLTIWSYIHGLVSLYLKKRLGIFDDNRELERIQESNAMFSQFLKIISEQK